MSDAQIQRRGVKTGVGHVHTRRRRRTFHCTARARAAGQCRVRGLSSWLLLHAKLHSSAEHQQPHETRWGPGPRQAPPPPFVCCTQKNEHSNNEHPRERYEVSRRGRHALSARALLNTPSTLLTRSIARRPRFAEGPKDILLCDDVRSCWYVR